MKVVPSSETVLVPIAVVPSSWNSVCVVAVWVILSRAIVNTHAKAVLMSAVIVGTEDRAVIVLAHTASTPALVSVTDCVVEIVVPLRFSVVVGLPTLAQSIPASPVEDTSSVLPAVVGLSVDVLRSVNEPTTEPTDEIESTVPAVITTSKNEPAA